jgi:hypothetical protein
VSVALLNIQQCITISILGASGCPEFKDEFSGDRASIRSPEKSPDFEGFGCPTVKKNISKWQNTGEAQKTGLSEASGDGLQG